MLLSWYYSHCTDEETKTQLTLPRSHSHTPSFLLNEDHCEEIILLWMKIGAIPAATISKAGIYLLSAMHCLTKKKKKKTTPFIFYFLILSKGGMLSQNKASVNESNIAVANRMVPKIIQDSYVITKFSGIFTFLKKKSSARNEQEGNKNSSTRSRVMPSAKRLRYPKTCRKE